MLSVGNAPLSWGVFDGDADTNPSWASVLDEIVEAGYRRLELGPIGFLPEDTALLADELARRDLRLTAGFVYEHMHDPTQLERTLHNTRRISKVLTALGAQFVVVMDRMVPERQRSAGRTDIAERLSHADWSRMMETVATVAEIAGDEFGLRPVLHPHCGGHIEFPDEIERALTDLPHETIGLCIDTGHSAVAGMQAADLVDRYDNRIEYFHFKDVDGEALHRMHDDALAFDDALAIGLFCPLGQGVVDFVALREALRQIGFAGLATVEQDPDPRVTDYSGLVAAQESIGFLERVGLARDGRAAALETQPRHPQP